MTERSIDMDDYFDRERFANTLISKLSFLPTPFVLGLDSPWGTGKSFFINNSLKAAAEDNIPLVIYDAFEREKDDDVLVSLVTSILEQAQTLAIKDNGAFVDAVGKLAAITGKLVSGTTYLAANTLARVLLKHKVSELGDYYSNSAETSTLIADTLDESVKDFILGRVNTANSYNSLKANFQEEIKKLACSLSNSNRIVVVIDELDRCTPNRALEVLETLHHLMTTTGVVFLISYYREQLQNMIEHRYGEKINSALYLNKFIAYDIQFPKLSSRQLKHAQFKILQDRLTSYGELVDLKESVYEDVFDNISRIEKITNLSARDYQSFGAILVHLRNSNLTLGRLSNQDIAILLFWLVKKPHLLQLVISPSVGQEELGRLSRELDVDRLVRVIGGTGSIPFIFDLSGTDSLKRDQVVQLIEESLTITR